MIIISNLVFLSIFLLSGGIIYFFAFYFLRIKHLIQNTPTSKIRSVAMGFVEVGGKVIPFDENGLLTSPFSNEKCVYYKYRIQEYRSSGKNSSWVTIKKGFEKKLFFIEDETGRILIDPRKAYIDISRSNTFNSGLGKDPPYTVIHFLESQNIRFEGPIFGINKRMRFIESFIKPNDKLYVMGTVEDNPFVKDASVIDGVTDMMITKGKNIKFYCISDKIEKSIKLHYSIISGVLFLAGTIILILTLIAFLKTVI